MKTCGKCGREMIEAAKFCPSCGAAQVSGRQAGEVQSAKNDTSSGLKLPAPSVAILHKTPIIFVLVAIFIYLYMTDFALIIKLTGNVEKYIKSGEACMEIWDYKQALKEFNKAIMADEKYAKAYAKRGMAYNAMRRYDEAKRDFDTALTLNNECVDAYIGLRSLLLRDDEDIDDYAGRSEKYDNKILEICNKLLKSDPNNAQLYIARATAYPYDSDKWNNIKKTMISDYSKAIDLDPSNAEAYLSRANIFSMNEQYDKALLDINKALDLNPRCIRAYVALGDVYAEKKDWDKVIEIYTNAIDKVKPDANFYSGLGHCYEKKKELNKALENYTRAIELDPGNSYYYSHRANLYTQNGDYDLAINDCNTVIKMYPKKAFMKKEIERILEVKENNYIEDKIRHKKIEDNFEGLWVSDKVACDIGGIPSRWELRPLSGMTYNFFSGREYVQIIMIAKRDNHYEIKFIRDNRQRLESNKGNYSKQIEEKIKQDDGGWWRTNLRKMTANASGNQLNVIGDDMGTVQIGNDPKKTLSVKFSLIYGDDNTMHIVNFDEKLGGIAVQNGKTYFDKQFDTSQLFTKHSWDDYEKFKESIWQKGLERLKNGQSLNSR